MIREEYVIFAGFTNATAVLYYMGTVPHPGCCWWNGKARSKWQNTIIVVWKKKVFFFKNFINHYLQGLPCCTFVWWNKQHRIQSKSRENLYYNLCRLHWLFKFQASLFIVSCQKLDVSFQQAVLIWVSGEWTYYMHGHYILGTKWLRIQNTLQQSSFHPSLTFTHHITSK